MVALGEEPPEGWERDQELDYARCSLTVACEASEECHRFVLEVERKTGALLVFVTLLLGWLLREYAEAIWGAWAGVVGLYVATLVKSLRVLRGAGFAVVKLSTLETHYKWASQYGSASAIRGVALHVADTAEARRAQLMCKTDAWDAAWRWGILTAVLGILMAVAEVIRSRVG